MRIQYSDGTTLCRIRLLYGFAAALGAFALGGCGGDEAIGGNTGCGKFLRLSDDDQERAIVAMHKARGKGTSQGEIATALGSARAFCPTVGEAGAIGGIYGRSPTRPASPAASAADRDAEAATTFMPKYTYNAHARTQDGTSAELRVELGAVSRPAEAGRPTGFPDPGVCSVDPQRDAVIPGRIGAANTTSGFTASVPVGFNIKTSGGIGVESSSDYSTGPACEAPQDQFDDIVDIAFSDVPPNETRTHAFFLVLHGYYSPSQPDGDTAWLARVVADFDVRSTGAPGWQVTCVEDPGEAVFGGSFTIAGGDARAALAELRGVPQSDVTLARGGNRPAC